jgi:hypothetical protein
MTISRGLRVADLDLRRIAYRSTVGLYRLALAICGAYDDIQKKMAQATPVRRRFVPRNRLSLSASPLISRPDTHSSHPDFDDINLASSTAASIDSSSSSFLISESGSFLRSRRSAARASSRLPQDTSSRGDSVSISVGLEYVTIRLTNSERCPDTTNDSREKHDSKGNIPDIRIGRGCNTSEQGAHDDTSQRLEDHDKSH